MAVPIFQVLAAMSNSVDLDKVKQAEELIDEKLSDVQYVTNARRGNIEEGYYYRIEINIKMSSVELEELCNRYLKAGYPVVQGHMKGIVDNRSTYIEIEIYTQSGKNFKQPNLVSRQGAFLTQPGAANPSQEVTAHEFIRQLNTDQDKNMNAAILALNEAHQEKMKATYNQYRAEATHELSRAELKNTP